MVEASTMPIESPYPDARLAFKDWYSLLVIFITTSCFTLWITMSCVVGVEVFIVVEVFTIVGVITELVALFITFTSMIATTTMATPPVMPAATFNHHRLTLLESESSSNFSNVPFVALGFDLGDMFVLRMGASTSALASVPWPSCLEALLISS